MRGLLIGICLVGACGGDDSGPIVVEEPDAQVLPRCSEGDLPAELAALPSVTEAVETPCGSYVRSAARCFRITMLQPVQHAVPGGATFPQHLFLAHRGCDRPVLVADWGYANDMFFDDELTVLYRTNDLWIEHRFQGESVPAADAWDWSALTIENGADDLHDVVTAFKAVYAAHWVSTGASKGGITATYHSFFFPHDLDGAVPYVAPASRARIDTAYQDRLGTVLPAQCSQRVRDAQVAALTTRRASLLPQLTPFVGTGNEPSGLELFTETLDWAFWQYYGMTSCAQVPDASSTDAAFWSFFRTYSGLDQLGPAPTPGTDQRSNGALDYEWLTEQGFALETGAHVTSLLQDPYAKTTMEERFGLGYPGVTLPAYDGHVTAATRTWVRDQAENMLLLYGEYDPWSGGAMDAPTQPSSARYFVPAGTHGARISALRPADRAAVLAITTRLFGLPPVDGQMANAAHAADTRDAILRGRMLQQQRRR